MMSLDEKIGGLAFEEELLDGYEQLEELFGQGVLDEITDFDREDSLELSFLVSLNRAGIRLSSEDLDILLEEEDACFLEIAVSREKPLLYRVFWKYPKGSGGQDLLLSEVPFRPEHGFALDLADRFAAMNNLLVLTARDLMEEAEDDGETVSIYTKYFNRQEDNEALLWWKKLSSQEDFGG